MGPGQGLVVDAEVTRDRSDRTLRLAGDAHAPLPELR